MAKLKLRGVQTTYVISEEEGRQMKGYFTSDIYPPSQKLEIGQLNFRKSDIQLIELGGGDGEDKQEKWRRKVQDWNEYRDMLINYSPEQKAEINLEYFRMMWYAHTGTVDSKKEGEAKKIAIKFFENNPIRTVMDYGEIFSTKT